MVTLLVAGAVMLLLLIAFVVSYNGLVTRRNAIRNAWAQIDVQLKRRHDLVPNLVETVKGYAAHERQTLDAVVHARTQAMSARDPEQMAHAEGMLSGALMNLFSVSEQYPDLKADRNFRHLQEELVVCENRVAYSRQYYNDAVLTFNNAIQTVPRNVVAALTAMRAAAYFQAAGMERNTPQIRF
jgi:LemA protein